MTRSSRPYLARALYEWLLDNDLTPHLVVDASWPGVEVPRQFVQHGQIVLNASPTAVRDFFMENQAIGFSARFGGQPMRIMIPIEALLAVYASENGAGMVFGQEPDLEAVEGPDAPADDGGDDASSAAETPRPALSAVSEVKRDADAERAKDQGATSDAAETDDATTDKRKKKPALRVIK
ncbi:MAG: ClpXP protease specificity-enhancing factor [Halomonas subglaciescola]|nr:ClpXP protease specificity-enhancing factor [Halomonas subglaciescola]